MLAIFFGLDLTDEGFALNHLNNYSQFKGLFTHYGFIYGPIFQTLNFDISWLRAFNLASILSMSVLLIFLSCPTCDFQLDHFPRSIQRSRHSIPFLFSVVFGSLGLLSLWPFLTPTYGHVNFLAVLMIAIAICIYTSALSSANFWLRALLSCLFFAAGTYLLLASKIPSAVVFIPFTLLFALLSSFPLFLLFLISGSAGFVLWLIHLAINLGGLHHVIDDIALSFEILSFYESTYGFSALLAKLIPAKTSLFILGLSFSVVLPFLCFRRLCSRHTLLGTKVLSSTIAFIFLGSIAFLVSGLSAFPYLFALVYDNSGLLIFAFFVASFLILLFGSLANSFQSWRSLRALGSFHDLFSCPQSFSLRHQYLRNALCFFCFPFLYSLTSGNSFYNYASHSVVFVAASLLFWARFRDSSLSFAALFFCYSVSPFLLLVSVFGLYFAQPFLQPSLIGSDISQVYFNNSRVWVDARRARSLSLLKLNSSHAGFNPGDPVLDLSSKYPGLTAYLGGVPLGWPWILGYANGATNVGLKIVEKIPKAELDGAWLILPSQGLISNLDHQRLLTSLGIDISSAPSRPAFEFECLDQPGRADCSVLFYRFSSFQPMPNKS